MAEEEQPTKELSLIERADLLAARLEKANVQSQELLKKQEEMLSRELLGGKSEAGKQEEKKPEIDPREYAKRALQGQL